MYKSLAKTKKNFGSYIKVLLGSHFYIICHLKSSRLVEAFYLGFKRKEKRTHIVYQIIGNMIKDSGFFLNAKYFI